MHMETFQKRSLSIIRPTVLLPGHCGRRLGCAARGVEEKRSDTPPRKQTRGAKLWGSALGTRSLVECFRGLSCYSTAKSSCRIMQVHDWVASAIVIPVYPQYPSYIFEEVYAQTVLILSVASFLTFVHELMDSFRATLLDTLESKCVSARRPNAAASVPPWDSRFCGLCSLCPDAPRLFDLG